MYSELFSRHSSIISNVAGYYSDKIKSYGASPLGVDWKSKESQETRFKQLLKVCEHETIFSIIDFGCGYGYLTEYMLARNLNFSRYVGFDISADMIRVAMSKYSHYENVEFTSEPTVTHISDYLVASGIFNVKLSYSQQEWENYILDMIKLFNELCRLGFSFNMLTTYSDKDCMKDYLYYADPCFYFDYCKKHYSKNVALLHDYGLYEFTILVRK